MTDVRAVGLLNDVVLNQGLFRFDSDERTDEVLQAVQDAGDVWMSGTAAGAPRHSVGVGNGPAR